MRLIDTHCHIHFRAYREDMNDVIRHAIDAGVFMITVGTQSETSMKAIEVAEKYDGVWATVGLHPSHLVESDFVDSDEADDNATTGTSPENFDYEFYKKLARGSKKVVAIGEFGLDYYRLPAHLDRNEVIKKQKAVMRQHLELADELNLPCVIHCRDAHDDALEMLKEFIAEGKLKRRGVMHCFTGTIEEAHKYIEIGFMISFTGIITFPPKKSEGEFSAIQNLVRELPIEKIMIETDAPYLSPEPFRGEPNEPVNVKYVAQKIAELKGMPVEEVEKKTFKNAVEFFKL